MEPGTRRARSICTYYDLRGMAQMEPCRNRHFEKVPHRAKSSTPRIPYKRPRTQHSCLPLTTVIFRWRPGPLCTSAAKIYLQTALQAHCLHSTSRSSVSESPRQRGLGLWELVNSTYKTGQVTSRLRQKKAASKPSSTVVLRESFLHCGRSCGKCSDCARTTTRREVALATATRSEWQVPKTSCRPAEQWRRQRPSRAWRPS
mmetsp:Transcript_46797/g.82620  ORF Transcript_46797/g.82620 Transcript_46797/m.82620 type:complete len:202 (+) Transcript_46797:86-691(+)